MTHYQEDEIYLMELTEPDELDRSECVHRLIHEHRAMMEYITSVVGEPVHICPVCGHISAAREENCPVCDPSYYLVRP